MKKLLLILGLAIGLVCQAQTDFDYVLQDTSGAIIMTGDSVLVWADEGYEAEYQTVLDAMTTDPTGDTLTWQNAMVKSLKDGGYWSGIDALYIFAGPENGDDETFINWVNPGTFDITATTSPTWSDLEGYTGNGTSQWLISNYDPGNDAVNTSQNSMTLATYNRLDVDGSYYEIGVGDGTNQISLASSYDGTAYTRINTSSSVSTASTNSQGFFMATRRSSTNVEIYRNGLSLVESTSSTSGTVPSGVNISICARNISGSYVFTVNQISIALIMEGVSDSDAATINTIFETYMDAIGKGVQ